MFVRAVETVPFLMPQISIMIDDPQQRQFSALRVI